MTNDELQRIIEQLDEAQLKQRGTFAISRFGGGSDESYIKANKEGLQLFALELLKAAKKSEEILADTSKSIIPLHYDEDWVNANSDTVIQYIEPTSEKQKVNPKTEQKKTFIDRAMPYGCGLIAIILLGSIIIGLVTLFKWVF